MYVLIFWYATTNTIRCTLASTTETRLQYGGYSVLSHLRTDYTTGQAEVVQYVSALSTISDLPWAAGANHSTASRRSNGSVDRVTREVRGTPINEIGNTVNLADRGGEGREWRLDYLQLVRRPSPSPAFYFLNEFDCNIIIIM